MKRNLKAKTLLLFGSVMFGLAGIATFWLSVNRVIEYYKTSEIVKDSAVNIPVNTPVILPKYSNPSLLKKVSWDKIPALDKDDFKGAVAAFKNSCKMLLKRPADDPLLRGRAEFGVIEDWAKVCGEVTDIKNKSDFKKFLIDNFEPFAVEGNGTFTGYYEATVNGSLQKSKKYQYPIFGIPDALIEVKLKKFGISADKDIFFGRIVNGKMVPYYPRKVIDHKAKGPVIAWADNPVDVFILQIQGSGRIILEDKTEIRVSFAASNERPFLGVGRVLLDKGLLKSGGASMPDIRKWLLEHPKKAKEIMNMNQRYIFFKKRTGKAPIGVMGMRLTPMRSMAVDPEYIPLGVPLWLDTVDAKGKPLQRIMFAQDVGSAIKGPVRGDFFWGFGDEAFNNAGAMKSKGTYYVILPKK